MDIRLEIIPFEVEEMAKSFSDTGLIENLRMGADYFRRIGYQTPWVGYLVYNDLQVIGNAAFKGAPIEGKVEIAYGIFDQFQHQGFGTLVAKALVEIAQKADPTVVVSARTLPESNFSTQILKKNGFYFSGEILDPEDGIVWEWIHQA